MAKQSKDREAPPQDRKEIAAEIYRALAPLAQKADSAGLNFLAYLLAVAAHHAEDEVTRTDEIPSCENRAD